MDYFDLKLQQRFAPDGTPRNLRREEELFYQSCAPTVAPSPARPWPLYKFLVCLLRRADTGADKTAPGVLKKVMG